MGGSFRLERERERRGSPVSVRSGSVDAGKGRRITIGGAAGAVGGNGNGNGVPPNGGLRQRPSMVWR